MTILNVSLEPDRACIAVDTLAYRSDGGLVSWQGRPCETSKSLVLAHAHCVIAVTGALQLLGGVQERSTWLPDVDTAIDRLPEILRISAQERGGLKVPTSVELVGWSNTAGRFLQASFDSTNGGFETYTSTVVREGGLRISLQPGVASAVVEADPPITPDAMLRLVRRQMDAKPDGRFGGQLVVAVLTRDSIALSCAGDLGFPKGAEYA